MIFSVLCRDYQWAEIAANTAESGMGQVISIHPEEDETDIERFGLPLRVWIRGNEQVQRHVEDRLEGHYA